MRNGKTGKKPVDQRVRPAMSIAVGAGSFMMIVASLWWAGLACALAGLILGAPCLKKEPVAVRMLAVVGVTVSMTGAIAYLIFTFSLGGRLGIT